MWKNQTQRWKRQTAFEMRWKICRHCIAITDHGDKWCIWYLCACTFLPIGKNLVDLPPHCNTWWWRQVVTIIGICVFEIFVNWKQKNLLICHYITSVPFGDKGWQHGTAAISSYFLVPLCAAIYSYIPVQQQRWNGLLLQLGLRSRRSYGRRHATSRPPLFLNSAAVN